MRPSATLSFIVIAATQCIDNYQRLGGPPILPNPALFGRPNKNGQRLGGMRKQARTD